MLQGASGLAEAPALTIINDDAAGFFYLPALVGLAPVRLPVLLLVPGYQHQLASVIQAKGGATFEKEEQKGTKLESRVYCEQINLRRHLHSWSGAQRGSGNKAKGGINS